MEKKSKSVWFTSFPLSGFDHGITSFLLDNIIPNVYNVIFGKHTRQGVELLKERAVSWSRTLPPRKNQFYPTD